MPRRDIQATTETAPCQATKSVLQQSNDNNRRWRGGRLAKRWCKKDENSGNRTKKQLLRAEQIRIFRKFILQSPKENPRKLEQIPKRESPEIGTESQSSLYGSEQSSTFRRRVTWVWVDRSRHLPPMAWPMAWRALRSAVFLRYESEDSFSNLH